VAPVKGRLLVDAQGQDNFVEVLFLYHQLEVTGDLVLPLQTGHPSAGVLGETPVAGLAFVALGALVSTKSDILRVRAVRTDTELVIELVTARGDRGQVLDLDRILDFL
tara:strand:- start:14780 stop:15103 length:324 start_codon:yes stop_codon:yes gene_type:complete